MKNTFTWLHLSDLHVGQKTQEWLWPNLKTIFLEDLKLLLEKTGPVDVVIFSGDLTQSGKKEEYDELTEILKSIWQVLESAGSKPFLFPVPGNHDLVRPDPELPESEVIKDWWGKPKVQETFWSRDSRYFPHVTSAFINYENWIESISTHSPIPIAPGLKGIIPGDMSITLDLDGMSVGIVGLNSAFLQLSGHEYESKLSLDVRQLLAVTNDAPAEWCLEHDINFLVTHHPSQWLKNIDHFEEHIYHPDRFTAHLFGHLHEIDNVTTNRGNSGRKSVQAASLFGLEYLGGTSTISRSHGYSVGQIVKDADGASWKLWPRKSHVGRDRARKFIPDHDLPLEPGEEFLVERLKVGNKTAASKTITPVSLVVPNLAAPSKENSDSLYKALEEIEYKLHTSTQHEAIRVLEQQTCCYSIQEDKISWIVSDWGLGVDGFIGSVLARLGSLSLPAYKIDLGNYESREDFLSSFSRRTGGSFTEFCKIMGLRGPSILILDEAPTQASASVDHEADAGKLARMIQEFCGEITIFLISRSTPKQNTIRYIKLGPLDEADTREYLLSHPESDPEATSEKGVSDIYRYTEGIPGKIDRALKRLRVVGLSELAGELAIESKDIVMTGEAVPAALIQSVNELMESTSENLKKSFTLLKILSVLPSGEALQRIKYFSSRMTLRIEHAEELFDRELIEVRTSSAFIKKKTKDQKKLKILFAPRQVRDYVLRLIPEDEIDILTKQAIGLYFGEKWRSGAATLHAFSDGNDSDDKSILQNAHTLVIRLLTSAVAVNKTYALNQAITVCKAYCNHGEKHRHYRDMIGVCRDILAVLPQSTTTLDRGFFELALANALRMTNNKEEALTLYEKLRLLNWSNSELVSILLNYALCIRSTSESESIALAKEIIKMDKNSFYALQAHTLILEIQAEENSISKLTKIQKDARRRGANVAANNIALNLARHTSDSSELEKSLIEVRETSEKEKDFYNASRAAIQIAKLYSSRKIPIPVQDFSNLVNAYQYLFGQRLGDLFNSAHKLLWSEFEKKRDIPNLLVLFKHSSFIWRLGDSEDKEKEYSTKLIKLERKILQVNTLTANSETAYFLSRSGKQLLIGATKP